MARHLSTIPGLSITPGRVPPEHSPSSGAPRQLRTDPGFAGPLLNVASDKREAAACSRSALAPVAPPCRVFTVAQNVPDGMSTRGGHDGVDTTEGVQRKRTQRDCAPAAPARTARRLQGYFAYANRMNGSANHACDMPLGRVGRTGPYDRCRVWLVAGWSSVQYFDQGPGWYGMLRPQDPNAKLILDAWVSQFSRVRRSGGRTVSDETR